MSAQAGAYRAPKQHRPPPDWMSRMLSRLLRSRWHGAFGLSEETAVLNVHGRKTGRLYSVPITYYQQDEAVFVTTSAKWARNVAGGADVTLWLRGRHVGGHAELVTEPLVLARAIEHWIRLRPKLYADLFHVGLTDGREPVVADIRAAAEGSRGLIRIDLVPG